MSARETVMQAVAIAIGSIVNTSFFRSREAAFAKEEGTCILLEPEEEKVEKRTQMGPALTVRRLTIVITVVTRADIPDQTADPVLAAIQAALLRDPTIGGLCAQVIELGTRWAFAEADSTASTAEIRYDLMYQTTASSLTQQ